MPDSPSSAKIVNIAAIGPHFLYLPVLFAINKRFFGYVPAAYEIKSHFSGSIRSDLDVFNYVLDPAKGDHELRFGIADPMFYYHKSGLLRLPGNKPSIMAGILNNSGFWAVDTKRKSISHLQDLADTFDNVICYGPDTTSHRVASHISGLARGKSFAIDQVASNTELSDYKERVSVGSNSGSVFVLSPDILGIESLMRQDGRVRIELPLASATEFTGDIVSTLIGAERVISDNEHAALIQGLICGLQASLMMVLAKHEDVMNFARDYFQDATYADSAINNAIEHGIFASSIEISRSRWDKTTENSIAYFEGRSLSKTEITERSSAAYDAVVAPYRRFWRTALTLLSAPLFESLLTPRKSSGIRDPANVYLIISATIFVILSVSVRMGVLAGLATQISIEASLSLVAGLVIDRFFASIHKCHCGLTALAIFLTLFLCYTVLGSGSFSEGSVSFSIILALVALLITFSTRARDWLWPH